MQKPDKFLPAVYGGLIMGVISAVPFLNLINCLCCAGILLGGYLAVFFYKSNFTPDTPPFMVGDCLAVGAMAGVVGAVVATLLSFISIILFGDIVKEFVLHFLEGADLEIPEEIMDEIRQRLQESSTSIASIFFELISSLILYPIFGLLGGLIGYGVWKPKPPMMQSPTTS